MTRHRASWGCNEDAGNGRRRLRWWGDAHDGRGYRRCSKTIVGSKRDGDLELARLMLEHSEDAPVPTLREAYETWWLTDAKDRVEHGELARSTYDNYRSRWNRHVCPAFGHMPVTDITPLAIQNWVLDLTKAMGSMSLALMSQVLDLCVRYGVLESNPAANRFRMPRRQERERAKDVWGLEAMGVALEAAKGSAAYLPAVLCGVASCRVGESLGARVDLGEVREVTSHGMTLAVVDVVRQIGREGQVMDRLKTPQSRRSVIVPEPWSLDVLAQGGPWLCGGVMPTNQHTANKVWADVLGAAGIEPIPMANLRNSWRTYMRWELGVPEDMLEKMMGHAGRGVGERHYDRPEWEVFADVAADAWARRRDR